MRHCCVAAVTMARASVCFLCGFLPHTSKGCVPIIYCCWNSLGTVDHTTLSTWLSVYNSYAVSVLKYKNFYPSYVSIVTTSTFCTLLFPRTNINARVEGGEVYM